MTHREAINSFLESITDRSGRISQDSAWSKRLILFWLTKYKNKIVSEYILSKKYPINRANHITIPCMPLKEIDQVECPCPAASGYRFLRTIYPVPKSVLASYDYVTTILANKVIDFVRWDSVKDRLNSRYEGERNSSFYTIKNINSDVHIYLYNDLLKENISITALFEDDLEAYHYPTCDGSIKHTCSPLDEQFVIDSKLFPIVAELTFEKLMKYRGMAPLDIYNNETSDTNVKNNK